MHLTRYLSIMSALPKNRARVALAALLLLALFPFFIAADSCEGGVLKGADGSSAGTCTVTIGGNATNVTCANNQLLNASGAAVGTCAVAQQPSGALLRDGIFGCNASKYANIGSLSAVGGVYVPVNDAAVTLNTGYLVYKECVLDGVVSKISEAARTELAGTIIRHINTGRQGSAYFVRNQDNELKVVIDDPVWLTSLSDQNMSPVHPAFRAENRGILARHYINQRNDATQSYASSYPGTADELRSVLEGNGGLRELGYLVTPGNDPWSSFMLQKTFIESAVAQARFNQREQWQWGNGFYSVTDNAENPFARQILTPAHLVAESAGQAITSGFRCLEGADELSEVCASMFSAFSTAAITQGLSELTRPQSGVASYVNRMTQEAASAVRQEAVNAALAILTTSRQVEGYYKAAKDAIANVLTNAINRLRSAERSCWELIIQNVCATELNAQKECQSVPPGPCTTSPDGTQSCPTPFTLKVATSTRFSQTVIDAEIAPIATIVAEDVKKSERALLLIDELIGSVTNSSSATNQRAALERLDQLVANGDLHTSNDATNANKQREDVTGAANTLVEDTLKTWGDSPETAVGWCNINNPSVIASWINTWKK